MCLSFGWPSNSCSMKTDRTGAGWPVPWEVRYQTAPLCLGGSTARLSRVTCIGWVDVQSNDHRGRFSQSHRTRTHGGYQAAQSGTLENQNSRRGRVSAPRCSGNNVSGCVCFVFLTLESVCCLFRTKEAAILLLGRLLSFLLDVNWRQRFSYRDLCEFTFSSLDTINRQTSR